MSSGGGSFQPSQEAKKSLFSPAQPWRAETRLFPCVVLASLRGSTYRSVRLASSLAAALLDSLFELPAWCVQVFSGLQTSKIPACQESVLATCQRELAKSRHSWYRSTDRCWLTECSARSHRG